MKRVLITGATGFIGRHAIRPLLERGFEVHATYHKRPALGGDAVWHRVDLLDSSATTELVKSVKPSHLLHFAWYIFPRDWRESPENLRWLSASVHLLTSFAEAGGFRAVFTGTCFEYDQSWGLFSESETPAAPNTLYATCKNALREVMLAFAKQAGLSAAWGRIFYLYGPYESEQRLVPSVIRSLLKGERAKCTHGRQIRDFLYVEDVADAVVALLDSKVEGVVNIASGEPTTVRQIVELIAAMLGAQDRVDFGAVTPVATDPPVAVANVNRLQFEVGWRPRWTLEKGLASTIEWCVELTKPTTNLKR